jgi:hypothetical protein
VQATGSRRADAVRTPAEERRLHRDLRWAAEGARDRNRRRQSNLGHVHTPERLPDRSLESALALALAARRSHVATHTPRR